MPSGLAAEVGSLLFTHSSRTRFVAAIFKGTFILIAATKRVGLIQALGRTKRCKGLAAVPLLWLGRFGWFLVCRAGSVVALRGVPVQLCQACALEFVFQHCSVVTVLCW